MNTDIQIKQWVHRGSMLVNTNSLDYDDPDHPYNQAIIQGVIPEDYGIQHPLEYEFRDKDRGQLLKEIAYLRKELYELYRSQVYPG